MNIVFFIALNVFINLIFLFFYKNLSEKLGLIDKPAKTNIHKHDVSLAGGIFIFLSVINWLLFEFLINDIDKKEIFGILFLITFSFFVNFFDDKNNIKPLKRILFLFIVAYLSFFFLETNLGLNKVYFLTFDKSVELKGFNFFLFASCIVLIQVVLNLIDGINALLKFFFITLTTIFFLKGFVYYENILFFLIPTFIILIMLNIKKKIFLGSTGNSLISLIISLFILKANFYNFQNISFEQVFLFLSIPLLDTLRLFCVRLFKYGNSFIKEKNHLHHKLYFKYGILISIILYILFSFIPVVLYEFITLNINLCIVISLLNYIFLYKLSK